MVNLTVFGGESQICPKGANFRPFPRAPEALWGDLSRLRVDCSAPRVLFGSCCLVPVVWFLLSGPVCFVRFLRWSEVSPRKSRAAEAPLSGCFSPQSRSSRGTVSIGSFQSASGAILPIWLSFHIESLVLRVVSVGLKSYGSGGIR
jgi:hypothetical protein